MKRTFDSADLERIWNVKCSVSFSAKGVSTDTRTIEPGDLFFCLSGENFDGHDFLDQALSKGAAACVVSEGRNISQKGIVAVKDPLEALRELARSVRSSIRVPVLAVCGSNGKTSTKDMAHSMASAVVSAFATEGNLNNHIGLPLTLVRTPVNAEVVILELGMNHPGELRELAKLARPHHAIVTSIADEHAEFFETLSDTARAEMEVAEGLEPGGTVLFHADAPCRDVAEEVCRITNTRLVLFRAGNPSVDVSGIHLDLAGERLANPHYLSPVMAENLTGAFELLCLAGLPAGALREAARIARPKAARRFQAFRKSGARTILLVDDSYNANQASFEAAITAMRQILPQGRLALFAGEMAELGQRSKDAHIAVGRRAARERFDAVFSAGGEDARFLLDAYQAGFKDGTARAAEDPVSFLEAFSADEYDGILVKGSRRARMERISDRLKEQGFS